MIFTTSQNAEVGHIDLNTHFCGIAELTENSMTLMVIPRNSQDIEDMTLVSVPLGQAKGVAENLKNGTLANSVSRLPQWVDEWPAGFMLYPYLPQMTPSGRLSKSTSPVYEGEYETLFLSVADSLSVMAKLCGGNLVSGVCVDYRQSDTKVYVEVLLGLSNVGGSVSLHSGLGRWILDNGGCIGKQVVALFGPDSNLENLYVVGRH